jgi:hypothetical protein
MHYQVVFNEWYHVSWQGYGTKQQHQAFQKHKGTQFNALSGSVQ